MKENRPKPRLHSVRKSKLIASGLAQAAHYWAMCSYSMPDLRLPIDRIPPRPGKLHLECRQKELATE